MSAGCFGRNINQSEVYQSKGRGISSFRNFENIDRDKVSILARVVSWKVEDK
ncbi:hypothetical protein [Kingella negevensis]|uniref:hypothetical protein n=1 Tax=Kingella negevensis TaxID=1522312 RepID=UPI0015C4FD38|nr:hypothetical protein [Kingella negevensis]MDK4680157.1 hypothetical protein [Kingella negevensis]MDK4682123.1 hypothetical protein [Kingella negevensis]MDK4685576.1 hypothetical protein [Kingella negevensis]MDK4690319.1 hypothetical protein [Kingella negevensis]MDK4692334.1 hypothetical protein [Kingella negevensis]